jgi:hypothetical protein
VGLVIGYFFTLVSVVFLGCYLYFQDQVEAVKIREEVVNSDKFVPPVPVNATTPTAAPAPVTPVATPPAPATTNLNQPVAPATATPSH